MTVQQEIKLEDVAELCVEYWRLEKVARRMADNIDAKQFARFNGQINFSARQLETLCNRFELKLVDFNGKEYTDGMPITAENLSDFPELSCLVISKSIEPAVIRKSKILRTGRVLLDLKDDKETN